MKEKSLDVTDAVLTGAHDPLLVALSIAIAITASYMALDLAERMRAAAGWVRRAWLGGAALALGGGIWSMHFVGMLAFQLPMPVAYDPGLTALSLAIPVLVTGIGFTMVGHGSRQARDLAWSGLLMGGGIAAMHYLGMAAMRMPANPSYAVPLVIASVLIAVVAATVALWMTRRETGTWLRLCAATAMGFAISGMHYTAMAAAAWASHGGDAVHEAHGAASLGHAGLALGVATITFLILFLGFLAALLDRRFAALAAREALVALRESEGRLQALADNLPSGMVYQVTTRRDGSGRRFTYVSRSCERLTGLPAQAILADPAVLYATIAPEDRAALAAAEEAAIRNLTSFEFDARLIPVNGGGMRWCHLASAPREALDGSLVWNGLLVDVTDHRRTEAALREQLRVNKAITDNAAVALFIMDEHQHCVFMNPAAEKLTGYALSEVRGRPLHDVVHHTRPDGSHYPLHECPIDRAFPERAQMQGEETFVHKDGSFYPVAFTASPIRHEETGAPVGTIIEVRDIRAEKAAAAELHRHRAELERLVEERTAALLRASEERRRAEEAARQAEKLAALGQLTGGVAHDFNNLLQVVTSGAALLKQAAVPEGKRAEILNGMIQAGKTARELTGRLLAFARQQTLHPETIDVGARLAAMSDLLRQTLGSRIQVETNIEAELWPVCADASQLEIAILNLAVNARDAMPDGGMLTIQARNTTLERLSRNTFDMSLWGWMAGRHRDSTGLRHLGRTTRCGPRPPGGSIAARACAMRVT